MILNQFNVGWWSCFISLYDEASGKPGEDIIDVIINVAKSASVTKEEIDEVIQFYGEDGLCEEVLGFLKRLKDFI